MHLPSLLTLSTALLATQAPAQFIRSMIPNGVTPFPSIPASSTPAATPSTPLSRPARPSMRPLHHASAQQLPFHPHAAHAASPSATPLREAFHAPHYADGGIAPIDPLQPDSDVAPVLIGKPSGKDEGNSFCMGQCYASEGEAKCSKPYASALYKEAQDCWMCCFTAGDF
ncbi:hypothetical protein N7462_009698 [Penicillium macrosclerotiorum]|uniref:uncharacterized protein n=1 Tax=Penicillium macrosclerotiorum TaxID=303699 RepID=UPI0025472BB5|nr:uncharacterized protein N7462_009698 [Penicillium macrosclerotiorum]KAJ5674259.1 hypothetical protein N7462_009698 [Penicillium macrosclerotiorum]